ncbi:TetR/AcrR family transcriptional regulator [Williamsia sp. MIQD14]|uniref:TetR/AcrR family transcriptional regulator n=1 Tax=Williamsia sp. MIQD14 TaxID=3425703 RepID=UPI003DA011A7
MPEKSTPAAAAAIVEATLRVVTERGLDRVTVREVAAEASVAIGTVQHWFRTKDDLIVAAFTAVVTGIRDRVDAVELGDDVRGDLIGALTQLLPLDDRRRDEARVQIAFAARAAVTPALAELQRGVLGEVRASLTQAFVRAGVADRHRCADAATAVLALVDGLAMHAVSSGELPRSVDQLRVVTLVVDGLLDDP